MDGSEERGVLGVGLDSKASAFCMNRWEAFWREGEIWHRRGNVATRGDLVSRLRCCGRYAAVKIWRVSSSMNRVDRRCNSLGSHDLDTISKRVQHR